MALRFFVNHQPKKISYYKDEMNYNLKYKILIEKFEASCLTKAPI